MNLNFKMVKLDLSKMVAGGSCQNTFFRKVLCIPALELRVLESYVRYFGKEHR